MCKRLQKYTLWKNIYFSASTCEWMSKKMNEKIFYLHTFVQYLLLIIHDYLYGNNNPFFCSQHSSQPGRHTWWGYLNAYKLPQSHQTGEPNVRNNSATPIIFRLKKFFAS